MEKWDDSCTHLTVEKLTLTIKVLQALIDEKPIVTLDYWAACEESLAQKLPMPNIEEYNKPPVAEQLLKSDFQYRFNSQRRSLFKDKMFVFQTANCKKQMEEVIEKCGGNCISWEETPKTYEEISESPLDYLLVKSEGDEDNASYDAMIRLLRRDNKRHIARNEIALAIVYCSCDVSCNANFNKLAEVFDVSTPKPASKAVLVTETQSQKDVSIKTEKIIPATVEDEWMTTPSGSGQKKNDDQQLAGPSGVKRPSKDTVESGAKKLKLEGGGVIEPKKVASNDFIGKQKPEIIVIDDSTPERKSSHSQKRKATPLENPFSLALKKKNKTSTEENENPFQIAKKLSKTTDTAKDNPFGILRTKTQQIKTEKIQPSKREIKLIPMQSNISAISPGKQSILNLTWMSKSTIKLESCKIEEDPELAIVIEAFKDCVQVKPMKEYVKPQPSVVECGDGRKNFKKFKKVKILHPQTRIISRNELLKCVAGDISHDLVRDNFNNDSDEDYPRGSNATKTVDSRKRIKREPGIKKFFI
ncbi:unnamed protein product [Ceutorhynchus assimilis]|uniref:Nibrin second BRCT domain-containing protein n=1 Tax=Ceutorhynchus assimilis TaxID=467358 RepID=A0A9N9N0Y0_9CUCU|nr:unnamed protein product [Ceutorhynchus assimilis]